MKKSLLLKLALLTLLTLTLLTLAACGQTQGELSCQVEISCATALTSPELPAELAELLPADGALFSGAVSFTEGETAHDIFIRALQQEQLQYETAADGSYFKAVSNLYSGDCGQLSGWMYSVDGEFVMDAVNQLQPSQGQTLALQYTCDMGADLGYVFE